MRASFVVGALAFVAMLVYVASQAPASGIAQVDRPYMAERDVVVLSGRTVCSLLGTAKTDAGIVGQDGGHSLAVGGRTYWTFGDSLLTVGGYLPNSIGVSDDTDASDCIDIVPKDESGLAAPLIEREQGELTVWPSGMVLASEHDVNLYYASVVSDPVENWRVVGVGMASFGLADLNAERLLDGLLVWKSPGPLPNRMFSDGIYIYSLLNSSSRIWVTDTILSRVPKGSFATPDAYEYWEPSTGEWIGGLWNAATSSWDLAINDVTPIISQVGLHNGIEMAYNPFLDSWLGVYAANVMTSINVRTAQDPLGPWSDEQTVLIDCSFFHGETSAPFACYTGVQHDTYSRDGGRTIYVTYSNGDDYQVYLHEIRLAASVYEWIGTGGGAVYATANANVPKDFTQAGLGFYASDIPVPGFDAIHQFRDAATGQNRYGVTPPTDGNYQDVGVSFYAPTRLDAVGATNELYSPVYRWTLGSEERYSPMNLATAGYERQEAAFYSPCPGGEGGAEASCLESIRSDEAVYVDSDGDGCTDFQELGNFAEAGGQRDPNNFWDFYDTPNRNSIRDGQVDLFNDVSGVLRRLNSNDDGGEAPLNRYSDPFSPIPSDPTAYHPAFDRSRTSVFAGRVDLDPPDGVINLVDLIGIIFQYGHSCAG